MENLINKTFNGNNITTLKIESKVWFLANDVAKALGYARANKAIRQHVQKHNLKTILWNKYHNIPGVKDLWGEKDFANKRLINKSGIYALALNSKIPQAQKFYDWVTDNVLPSIDKNGAYVTPQTAEDWLNNPDMMISVLKRYKQAKDDLKQSQEENKKLIPDASFGRQVTKTKDTITVGQLSKYLNQNGVDTGRTRLFRYLREAGFLMKAEGRDYNAPTQKSMNLGIMKNKERLINTFNDYIVRNTPLITGKGQRFFLDKLLDMKQKLFNQDNNIDLLDKD